MSDELKPCPFCGGKRLMDVPPSCHKNTPYDPTDHLCPFVRCMDCLAEVHGEANDGPHDNRSTQSAIDAWNTRADDTALVQRDRAIELAEKAQDRHLDLDQKHDAALARIVELEAALRPFADFAKRSKLPPDNHQMTQGSSFAAKQVTASEFRAARAALNTEETP